jgi:formylmethanofuran--tetrahydromethanopterin N-formyltransferase
MPQLMLNGVRIDDTFAEAFGMVATAIIITAPTARWAEQAAVTMTGFATSVIACGCEAGIDATVPASESPDGRPGIKVLLFSISLGELQKQLQNRVGQCVLTCPGTACYAGIAGGSMLKLGSTLRYFGDGWQISKRIAGTRYWRIPVMEGEFLCEASTGSTTDAVGGGNLLLMGQTRRTALAAAETAVKAMTQVAGVILPFPGGIVRSGSKVGSRYQGLIASTNDAYCPTLKGLPHSALDQDVGSVFEIVIDGLTSDAVHQAMQVGLRAAAALGPEAGPVRISAGNYGGKLGRFHYQLKELLA